MAAATATHADVGEVRVLREQVKVIQRVVRGNAEGLSQADSLAQPTPGGNCLNWVVGHVGSGGAGAGSGQGGSRSLQAGIGGAA